MQLNKTWAIGVRPIPRKYSTNAIYFEKRAKRGVFCSRKEPRRSNGVPDGPLHAGKTRAGGRGRDFYLLVKAPATFFAGSATANKRSFAPRELWCRWHFSDVPASFEQPLPESTVPCLRRQPLLVPLRADHIRNRMWPNVKFDDEFTSGLLLHSLHRGIRGNWYTRTPPPSFFSSIMRTTWEETRFRGFLWLLDSDCLFRECLSPYVVSKWNHSSIVFSHTICCSFLETSTLNQSVGIFCTWKTFLYFLATIFIHCINSS